MKVVWYIKENRTYENAIAFDEICCEQMKETIFGPYTELKFCLDNGRINFCPFCGKIIEYSGDKSEKTVYKNDIVDESTKDK
jgi:hypothetical protein